MKRPVHSVRLMLEMNKLVIFPVIMPSDDMQGLGMRIDKILTIPIP